MNEHSRPDIPIVHHEASGNGYRPHAEAKASPNGTAPDQGAGPHAGRLNPPRRFLLCHDNDLEADLPLIETIPPSQLDTLDPATVHGCGIETDDHALLSLHYPGSSHRDIARCTSAVSALSLFGLVRPLRLIFLDPV